MSKYSALVLAAALGLGISGAANAGKILVSGHDSDDSGHVSIAFGAQLLSFIGTGNTNGGSGILILGGNAGSTSDATINSWNASLGGGAFTVTRAADAAAIAAANFSNFAALFLPSTDNEVGGGITVAELAAINARAGDIASFVNGGGNLLALSETSAGAYGWFPLGALQTTNVGYGSVVQTAALAAAGFTATNAELNGDIYHNRFDGPAGFFGLSVLATDSSGRAAILGGGSGTIIITDPNQVPEPATLALLGAGLFGIGLARRRRAA